VKHAEVVNEASASSAVSEGTSGETSEDACVKHAEVSEITAASANVTQTSCVTQTSQDTCTKHAEVVNEASASSITSGGSSGEVKEDTCEKGPEILQGGQIERDAQKRNLWEQKEKLRMQQDDLQRKAIGRIPLALMRMNVNSWSRETIFAHTAADYVRKEVENATDSGYIYEEIIKFMECSSRSANSRKASQDYVNMIRDFYTKGMSRQQFEDAIGYLYIKCMFNADVTNHAYVDRPRNTSGASMDTKEELSWRLMIVTLALEHQIQIYADSRRVCQSETHSEKQARESQKAPAAIADGGIATKIITLALREAGASKKCVRNIINGCKKSLR
jgi:hypothetical protein